MAFETSRISTTTSLGFMSVKATNGTNTVTASGTGTTHTTGSLSCAAGDTIWVTAYYVDEAGTYNQEPWVAAINVATTITHGGYLQIVGSGAISPVTGNTVAVAASSNVSSSSTSIGFQRFFTSGEILQRGFSFTAASGHTQAQFRFRDDNSTSYEHLITVPISIGAAVTPPDTTITDVDTITRPNGSTNHSITIAAGSSNTIYEARTVSASGTVVGTRTGNGAITVASIPSAGTSATYYITGRVTTANGGDNSPVLADTYIVVHEAASSGGGTGDGGTGTYGLRVYDASGNTTLDLSDRVVTFRERVTGSLSSSQTTKNVTLSGAGTAVINLDPITVIFVSNIPQRQKILYFTVSGTTLTITRTAVNATGSAAAAQSYDLLVVYDPVA
jgi:hypothetical protein